MASDLLTIAKSGARTARIALDVTAQNIANASNESYVRRSIALEEVASTGGIGPFTDLSLSGVRLDRIVRNADLFRQSEARRTGSDAARATAELNGLEDIESAVEQAGIYTATVQFEASLQRLTGDPIDPSLRAAVIEDARSMATSFNLAAQGLDAVQSGLQFEAADDVAQVNLLANDLAKINLRLARVADASSDQTALLDQRDAVLQKLSNYADVSTSYASDQTVEVKLGGSSGLTLVSGGTAQPLAMATAADGTISFSVAGSPVALSAGSLAGRAQALDRVATTRTQLDGIAANVIALANNAQATGVALDGTPGQAMFSGTGAGNIALALSDGAALATAPAGAPAGSRDPANLTALRDAFANGGPAADMDGLLFGISSTIAGRRTTLDALDTIASTAKSNLQAQSSVDLDQEAVNLIRFQQAFQASGRAIQVASDIFDTLLAIR